jgi:uncharacterized protein
MLYRHRLVIVFVILANALAWLVALPLWLNGGLGHPLLPLIGIGVMTAPAIAAVLVSKRWEPNLKVSENLGLSGLKPIGRTLRYCALSLIICISIHAVALIVGALFGLYHFDTQEFSGFSEALKTRFAGQEDKLAQLPAVKLLVLLQLAMLVPGSLINSLPALGEEIGWRGWLLPKLLPMGLGWAIFISNIIWVLWHAPLLLLGYNYPGTPGWLGLLCMTGMCVPLGAILTWVRLRSRSVWPAAVGHGAFNAAVGLSALFSASGHPIDVTQTTALGFTGWIFPTALAVMLFKFYPIQIQKEKNGAAS